MWVSPDTRSLLSSMVSLPSTPSLRPLKVACCFSIALQVHEDRDHLSDSLPSITLGNTSQGLSK